MKKKYRTMEELAQAYLNIRESSRARYHNDPEYRNKTKERASAKYRAMRDAYLKLHPKETT